MCRTWVSATGWIRIMMAIAILMLLTACIGIPDRMTSVKHEDYPILWLYESEPSETLATLYKKTPGDALQLVAERIIPGSHRVHEDQLLFLDGQHDLIYMPYGQDPHLLIAGIEPYSYGFVNDGRQVFAVTENRELILKTFGLEPQQLIGHVEHAVPLPDRLIALTDNGQVYAFDYYGTGQMIAEGAGTLGATADARHAVIHLLSGVSLVTDGKDIRFVIESNGLGPVRLSRDGHAAAYLDDYDAETGRGALMVLKREDSGDSAAKLADEAGQFAWSGDDGCLWYEQDGSLYRYRMGDQEASLVLERISQFEHLPNGLLAAITVDGLLQIWGANGERFLQLAEDETVKWMKPFASGVLYETGSGVTTYWVAEQKIELGMVENVLSDGQFIVGVHQGQPFAWDLNMKPSLLLEDTRPYRYVYFDEQLLIEKLVQLQDIEGVWIAEDGHQLKIERSGASKGVLVFDDGDSAPFYVIYVAYDALELMIADLTDRTAYVKLQADGSLLLTMSEGMSKVYVRGGQDADMSDSL